MITILEKNEEIGRGAYGVVYKCFIKNETDESEGKKLAFKRNYGADDDMIGTSVLREMNFLKSFSHKNIIKLFKVVKGDPFNNGTALSPKKELSGLKEDKYHFLFEYVNSNLKDYYSKNKDLDNLPNIMFQITNGLYYLHTNKVIHRDLKPDNILISVQKEKIIVKICDFGLTTRQSKYEKSTPGTVTCYYRAPEICCGYDNYSFPIDMWSLGCIFYEIITDHVLFKTSDESPSIVFHAILKNSAEEFTMEKIDLFISKGDEEFSNKFKIKKKDSYKTKISKYIKEWDKLDGFCLLLDNLIRLDYYKRLTARECLEDDFFKHLNIEIKTPKKISPCRDINIIHCKERKIISSELDQIYMKKDWYNHYVAFHAVDLFDRFLMHKYKNISDLSETVIFQDKTETLFSFYVCYYMNYKYFSSINILEDWKDIFPKQFSKRINKAKIIDLEEFIIENVCDRKIVNDSLIELMDDDYHIENVEEKEHRIKHFFYNYKNLESDYKGTVDDLYDQIKEKYVRVFI